MRVTSKTLVLATIALIAIVVIVVGSVYVTRKTNPNQPQNQQSALPSTQPETLTITINENGYVPNEVTVKKGTRVIWANQGNSVATVNSADHPDHTLHSFINLGEVAPGRTVQTVFDQVGSFGYHNHLNPEQFGTVTVEE